MNTIYKIIFVLAILGLSSCSVDRFPYDSVENEQAIDDPNYLKNSITGVYGYMKGTLSASWINNAHRLTEYNGDNVALSGTTGDDLFYMYNYHHIDNGGRGNDFWTRSYKIIYGVNSIIENATEGNSSENDNYLGEAYFLRGMIYLYLSNVYGKPYSHGKSNLSVSLKLDTDVKNLPARSTVGEVYAQIVSDLLKASELLTIDKAAYYATKESAFAMLSRVYLYMEEDLKAVEYANKILSLTGKYRLLSIEEFKKINTLTPENNPESIFSIRYVTDVDEGGQNDVVGGFYSTIDGFGWGEMYASRSYLESAYYFPNDARQAFIMKKYANIDPDHGLLYEGIWVGSKDVEGTNIPIYKTGFYKENSGSHILEVRESNQVTGDISQTINLLKRRSATGVEEYYFHDNGQEKIVYVDKLMQKRGEYPLYFVTKCSLQENKIHSWSPSIIRLSEVLLNKCEALVKLGQRADAITLLNQLRGNRGVPDYVDGDVVLGRGNIDLLDVVLEERRLELAYEGHRAFDVFRNKKDLNRQYPGTHLLNSNSYSSISWTNKRIIQLLPIVQLNAQENLVQNEI